MPPESLSLERVQRWLQSVIVHPGGVEEALASPEAAADLPPEALPEVVRPSWSLDPRERVGIYHGMYLLRMIEALEADFPVIRHRLGADAFADLVAAYVAEYPSRSYTLNRLGDRLPEFLDAHPEIPDHASLADLARFELAVTQVFDEEETPSLAAEHLADLPPESWPELRLRPVAAFRLLALRHAVLPDLEAYHEDRPPPAPRRRATFLAVYRRAFRVYHLALSRPEHELLAALARGAPLGEALATAASRLPAGRREGKVFAWFRSWVAAGLFRAPA